VQQSIVQIESFDGARFLTRAFYINWLSAHAVKRAPSKALKIKES